jgi:outer membrane protein OmpA-like peptidoglycan-associated protein
VLCRNPILGAQRCQRERRLALDSVYFATAKPSLENPDAGLLARQEKTLKALASDFLIYLQSEPDARLTLEGHADPRGSMEYNRGLSERACRPRSTLPGRTGRSRR